MQGYVHLLTTVTSLWNVQMKLSSVLGTFSPPPIVQTTTPTLVSPSAVFIAPLTIVIDVLECSVLLSVNFVLYFVCCFFMYVVC